jgi:hypothetical protein
MPNNSMNLARTIQTECLEGKIDVPQAVENIDTAIEGITSVMFKTDKVFTVGNHTRRYSLSTSPRKKRQIALMQGLAVLAYRKARRNGSSQPGEVHISRQASTKDHMEGIREIEKKYN